MTIIHTELKTSFTFKAYKDLCFRIYPDNRPRNLEIAPLQKGLVLVKNGKEVVEEGAGFGVPVIKYADATLFSGDARTYLQSEKKNCAIVAKDFYLNLISTKNLRGRPITNEIYRGFHKLFQAAYLSCKPLRHIFDLTMHIINLIGMETRFVEVPPRGKITITYRCLPNQIIVNADLTALDKSGCQEILLLNEQGASTFNVYREANQMYGLREGRVGAWERVRTENAHFSDLSKTISFSLHRRNGAVLYRGWERIERRFSWAGMAYSLEPNRTRFGYSITISRQIQEEAAPSPNLKEEPPNAASKPRLEKS